ncbi:hypothetical protein [Cellulomonas sp. URHE0023]|uniref:hypothetical protein n=1 Tax=Cellulomonas sp. URHE0023 TaxID=1380354 RepID=UPI0006921613|nr:hypothetical protein [Cellulomonas sp. URHE0023]
MRRGALAVDRVVVLLLGLVLIALGVAVVGWQAGFLEDVWPSVPPSVQVDSSEVTGTGSFVVLAVAAGAVLVGLGGWWLAAHIPRRGVGPLRLPPGDVPGVLTVLPAPAVATAADVLADEPGVLSARGAVLTDRKQRVVRLRVAVYPDADLASVIASCDRVLADLAVVLPDDQLRSRLELSVRREASERARVQ